MANPDKMPEMYHIIAKEEGLFTMEDVVNEVAEKMVRRHPHVFVQEPVNVNSVEQVLTNWEDIKKKEKKNQSLSQNLRIVQ